MSFSHTTSEIYTYCFFQKYTHTTSEIYTLLFSKIYTYYFRNIHILLFSEIYTYYFGNIFSPFYQLHCFSPLAAQCPSPDVPVNGSVSLSDGNNWRSIATYSCADGYRRFGPRQRHCISFKWGANWVYRWTGTAPKCVRKYATSSPSLVVK